MNDDVRTVLTSSTHSSPSRGAWTTRRRPRARAVLVIVAIACAVAIAAIGASARVCVCGARWYYKARYHG